MATVRHLIPWLEQYLSSRIQVHYPVIAWAALDPANIAGYFLTDCHIVPLNENQHQHRTQDRNLKRADRER